MEWEGRKGKYRYGISWNWREGRWEEGSREMLGYDKTRQDASVTVSKIGGGTLIFKHPYEISVIKCNCKNKFHCILPLMHCFPFCIYFTPLGITSLGEITVDHFRLPTLTSLCCHGSCHVYMYACDGELVFLCIYIHVHVYLCHCTAIQLNY